MQIYTKDHQVLYKTENIINEKRKMYKIQKENSYSINSNSQ